MIDTKKYPSDLDLEKWNNAFAGKFKSDSDMRPWSDDDELYRKTVLGCIVDKTVIDKSLISRLIKINRDAYKECFVMSSVYCLIEDAMKHNFSLQLKRFANGDNSVFEIAQVFMTARDIAKKVGQKDIFSDMFFRHKRIELALLKIRQDIIFKEEDSKRKLKEEQMALKELKKEKEQAEKDVEKAKAAIEKNESALAKAKTSSQINKYKMQIEELKEALRNAEMRRERAISMAQQTKCGYVYVISNVDSFGEGVFKIGMTRRLDPMIRVRELGDASVPYPFNVHTFIYTEDAPGLESYLHNRFADKKMNSSNYRKEFFRVTLDEIKQEIHKNGVICEWVDNPSSSQWSIERNKYNIPYEFDPFEEC